MVETTKKFDDGCVVSPSINKPKKFVAHCSDGTLFCDEERRTSYFDSVEEAAAALAGEGQGPGRKTSALAWMNDVCSY